MVIGAGGVVVGTEQQVSAAVRRPSRREVARGLLASLAALALAPVVAASRPGPPAGDPDDRSFDETYRGRRIQGFLVPAVARAAAGGDWRITIDGRPLHLMRRADGTWLSMADHYTSYPTPLEATRAAVDQIGPGQRLRDVAPGPMGGEHSGHTRMGGQHGVRA
ncbi:MULTISPECIES: tyrosinase family oxidase copper chaperone [unclassified Streptomyces]|uniref:tyrosinase family oxidase copper chaperone n=1 Tax=unclassified Streptomyces TaxID=2593676 RepID=UPI0033FC1787